jgi:F-type H+-transporting ATPase subunit alpha
MFFTIANFNYTSADYGLVATNADGIISAHGLADVAYGELVLIYSGLTSIYGMAFNLERERTGIVVFGDSYKIVPGDMVFRSFSLISVPVGKALLGCVVDPLGFRLDEQLAIKSYNFSFIEQIAPSIISRAPVRQPLETGLKVVDSMVPIGHGQRELIIGDMKTGKTSVALDAIINQKGTDTVCIYVSIGQKMSTVARI